MSFFHLIVWQTIWICNINIFLTLELPRQIYLTSNNFLLCLDNYLNVNQFKHRCHDANEQKKWKFGSNFTVLNWGCYTKMVKEESRWMSVSAFGHCFWLRGRDACKMHTWTLHCITYISIIFTSYKGYIIVLYWFWEYFTVSLFFWN